MQTKEGITYECWCGLWFNIERCAFRKSLPVALGIGATLGEPMLEWFEALALSKHEAEKAYRQAMQKRKQ